MNSLVQVEDLASALAAGGRPATAPQLSRLQAACDVAAAIAVRLAGDRDFARQAYSETHAPTQDGEVFLRQFPVNGVSRISAGRSPAITIQCTASPARAWVAFVVSTPASTPPTGITLYSVSGGVTTSTPLLYSSLAAPSIASLGSAVSTVPGWTATVEAWASGYPCSDLVGAEVALPALGPGSGIAAYAIDVPGRLEWRTGILRLPRVELSGAEQVADPSWWPEVGGVSSDRVRRGRVLVQYDAGFDVIPPDVVAACVLIAIALLDRWKADFALMEEDLGNTSFKYFSPEVLGAIPKPASDVLGKYRIGRV